MQVASQCFVSYRYVEILRFGANVSVSDHTSLFLHKVKNGNKCYLAYTQHTYVAYVTYKIRIGH
jgi:hypothetical protein